MKKLILLLAAVLVPAAPCGAQQPSPREVARWQREARNVDIIRDDWGIAHVYGKTDADAVFGMIYAQAEDDFNRVETNYINAMGRLAEAEGSSQIWRDLRMKLFIDTTDMKAKYASSPAWLKTLMNAWADGLNYYLYTHPEVKPRVITRFQAWMPLTFSEGSIGGDIESSIALPPLAAFYGHDTISAEDERGGDGLPPEPSGSNGFAIAPKNTASHHALLWINPHTSFYFRSELQMASDQGLDAYGAVTWGQFFVYQGFNTGCGWMHTSSGVDAIDEYAETIVKKNGKPYYKYGSALRPVTVDTIGVPYRTANGGMARRTFVVYRTHHGPVVREADGKWITIRLMQKPVQALIQSYSRTRAHNLKQFEKIMELHTNSSNNTVFADSLGNIAYFHANFIPRRDTSFDWTKPVDGSDPRTEWHGVLSVAESPNVIDPPNGWLFNTNDAPWTAAGPYSPKKQNFPKYVEKGEENPRGVHATRVLSGKHDFTPASVIAAAFDSYLTEFAVIIPRLVQAYDATPATDPFKARLAEQIDSLRHWDFRWGAQSVPTALAVFWGTDLWRRVTPDAQKAGESVYDYLAKDATPPQMLASLAAASDKLTADFGSWKTPWGEINRFQRINDDVEPSFDDAKPSYPIPFTSSLWGSLASFGARQYPNTKKWYGSSGNSFVAIVQFGDSVRARAVTAGGESGHPDSPHFADEIERYATGNLRTVYYYRSQLKGHTEKEYHPGER